MSVSEENIKKVAEIAGAQKLSNATQKKLDHAIHRFQYNFPSLDWFGNTPIVPTGAGVTEAEAITWIRMMLAHLNDWVGKLSQDLYKLYQDLNDLNVIIQEELAEQLPEIIQEFDLFDLIVTGNNEHISLAGSDPTTLKAVDSVFTYGFRTEYGFVEATKTKMSGVVAGKNVNTWLINSNEADGNNVLDYQLLIGNIPENVNRVWVINKEGAQLTDKKEIYFIDNESIYKGTFNKDSAGGSQTATLQFDKLNTNYNAHWIVNVLKRVPKGKNYLRYMTLDYKVWEYDLDTGDETFQYEIPIDKQGIFDPISDVIEGKSTIWAITYKGTTNRVLKEMNGLCFEPCFDGVEMYDTWETPKMISFTDNYSGINPANMFVDYANKDEKAGDKALLSAFILTQKADTFPYVISYYELTPRKFDNRIVSSNLDHYFKDSLVNDLGNNSSLGDFQGYFSYDVTRSIGNFNDAPSLLINDTLTNDGAKIVLSNSEFLAENDTRTLWQRLIVGTPDTGKKRTMRVFERMVQQKIVISGLVMSNYGRWYDSSLLTVSETIDKSKVNGKLDYLSLAGSHRTFEASDYEQAFTDTPIKTYKYYDLPLDSKHPLLTNLDKKNVIIEVTKGANYEGDSNQYETVIKLTYQDEYAELQFRRLMRFDRRTDSDKVGGRNRANYVSPWAYVYYTTPDDTAPDGYDKNPNQGIDQKFQDIINNLQNQINQINNQIKNIYEQLGDIINKLNGNNDVLEKILEKLKDINVWNQTGDTIIEGSFKPNMGIAGGNINLFGGAEDGSSYIRTNKNKTENDIVGGV